VVIEWLQVCSACARYDLTRAELRQAVEDGYIEHDGVIDAKTWYGGFVRIADVEQYIRIRDNTPEPELLTAADREVIASRRAKFGK